MVFHFVRRKRPRERRKKNRVARCRGKISENRISSDGKSKRGSGKRQSRRKNCHHRFARDSWRENGKSGKHFARGFDGLPCPSHLRPCARGIRTHVARLD